MMNTYDELAASAKAASVKADQSNTRENCLAAASLHLAASSMAWQVGNGDAIAAHNKAGVKYQAKAETAPLQANDATTKGDKSSASGALPTSAKCPNCEQDVPESNVIDGKAKCPACNAVFKPGSKEFEIARSNGSNAEASDARKVASLQAASRKRLLGNKELQASVMDNGYSFNDLQSKLRAAVNDVESLKTKTGSGTITGGPWVMDIICPEHEEGETWEAIVSGPDNKLFKVSFTLEEDGVEIVGEPEQVQQVTDYEEVAKSGLETASAKASGALESGRAEKTAIGKYHAAALAACNASAAIPKAHAIAASMHKIANEHALMAGDAFQNHAFMHTAKAKEHEADLEACNGKLPSKMEAGGDGKDGLEAANPEGINQYSKDAQGNMHRAEDKATSASKAAGAAGDKAKASGTIEDHTHALQLHIKARNTLNEAAEKSRTAGYSQRAEQHADDAQGHLSQIKLHSEAIHKLTTK